MKKQCVSLKTILMVLFVSLVFVTGCSDDEDTTPKAVKTALEAAIVAASKLHSEAEEGTAIGKYLPGSKATLKTAIDAATAIINDASVSQTAVDNAIVHLNTAAETFKTNIVAEIAPQSLVGHWKFDGDAKDVSGKGNNGSLKAGSALWGAGMPTLTADRFGVANMAYHFDKGGNIEVPYTSALNPANEITISLWAKLGDLKANNYMVALNRWNGYKLNFQDTGRAFFTAKTEVGGPWDHDSDALFTADLGKWYHVVVTYKAGTMDFYIDGGLVKSWTDATRGTMVSVKNNINLVFGQDLPTNLYSTNDKNDADGNNFFGEWGGYFTGDMDDIRIYNVALSASQISALNAAEKSK